MSPILLIQELEIKCPIYRLFRPKEHSKAFLLKIVSIEAKNKRDRLSPTQQIIDSLQDDEIKSQMNLENLSITQNLFRQAESKTPNQSLT